MANDQFWAGRFGDEYTERNRIDPGLRAPFFTKILKLAPDVSSVCEIGANRGHNLRALRGVDSNMRLTGVEINAGACAELKMISDLDAINASVHQFQPAKTFDLVFTCGLLIHISPDDLESAYANIARAAGRYVLFIEYFNPTPVEIHYRGHSGKLFKRDFAGEFLDAQSHFDVVQYGFLWKRIEPAWDNATWTLLQRQKG